MVREVFVDSSGIYALADRRDPCRPAARRCVADLLKAGTGLVPGEPLETIPLARPAS